MLIRGHTPTVARLAARAISVCRRIGVEDADEILQQLELIVIVHEADFDAGRGATRDTYYIRKLKNWALRTRASARFGVELDGIEGDEEKAVLAFALDTQSVVQLDDFPRSRIADDADFVEKIGGLWSTVKGREVLRLVMCEGKSCAQAAALAGLCSRQARRIVEETVEFLSGSPAVQPTLF